MTPVGRWAGGRPTSSTVARAELCQPVEIPPLFPSDSAHYAAESAHFVQK